VNSSGGDTAALFARDLLRGAAKLHSLQSRDLRFNSVLDAWRGALAGVRHKAFLARIVKALSSFMGARSCRAKLLLHQVLALVCACPEQSAALREKLLTVRCGW
jgi:hypothetical protein